MGSASSRMLTLNDGFMSIPPDAIGAAGPSHVIAVVNSMIEARSKTGDLEWRTSLENFLRATDTPLDEGVFPFDPKIIYDRHAGRFVVVGLELSFSPETSRILLAVSKDSTPDGPSGQHWFFHKVNGKTNVPGAGTGQCWADYPGFEVDEEAVYVTANLFDFGLTANCGVRLWIIAKTGFYDGGTPTVKKRNPYANAGIPITTMPAEIQGAGGAGPVVGTFLVSYSGLTDGTNEFIQLIRVRNPLGATTFVHTFVGVGNIEDFSQGGLQDAPQKGTGALIEVNDRRALDAAWWNNELWMVTTIDPVSGPDAGQTTAHWFRVRTTGTPTLLDQGNIGGEDIAPNTFTYFPAVAVNNEGHVKFGFSASAPTTFGGAYATGRLHNDPPGTVRESETLRAGRAPYLRTFGGPRNRWGDYSGISIDPVNNNAVWIYNQFADTRGTATTDPDENGRWGTAWGRGAFE